MSQSKPGAGYSALESVCSFLGTILLAFLLVGSVMGITYLLVAP